MARKPLREPIEGKMNKVRIIKIKKKTRILFRKNSAIPKNKGRTADKKAPNAFGSLNVEFSCPSPTHMGELPRSMEIYFWKREKIRE
ncbi:MAG: hypothetical protein NTV82_02500, partial [Candidatus Aminicenantes bacterium]|nr:hypothetical protein [Candidatus Aminicenantes bacterium]